MGLFETLIKESTKKTVAKVVGNTIEKIAVKTVDGVNNYNENKVYEEKKKYAFMPFSSDDYGLRNYKDVMEELTAFGFTNIAILPIKDLIKGWLTKDGEVEEISINGKEKFKKNAKFETDSRIVIKYHTFKDK